MALKKRSSLRTVLDFTGSLTFGEVLANEVGSLTVKVQGAKVGDTVALGLPTTSGVEDGICYNGIVTASGSVTLYAANASAGAITIAAGVYRLTVIRL